MPRIQKMKKTQQGKDYSPRKNERSKHNRRQLREDKRNNFS